MAKTLEKAQNVLTMIKNGSSVSDTKSAVCSDDNEWFRVSAKAYQLVQQKAKKERKLVQDKPNVGATKTKELTWILDLNEKLADFAFAIPSVATMPDARKLAALIPRMPDAEMEMLSVINTIIMHPSFRSRQSQGRYRSLSIFKEFSKLFDAAALSYYRGNFISCYLTLVPTIEGLMLRWLGFTGNGEKPEFEKLRKFFPNAHERQPNPANPLFHSIFCKACDQILNLHYFRPSNFGAAYADFNRHLAAHLLAPAQFATQGNCVRLFLLIDLMAEIFLYESKEPDARFGLGNNDLAYETTIYSSLYVTQIEPKSPENMLLNKKEDNR